MSLNTFLTEIADAIREKKGTTEPINASEFANEIKSIKSGGGVYTQYSLIDFNYGKSILSQKIKTGVVQKEVI